MAEDNGIYKCEACGNVVNIIHNGRGVLVCCEKEMQLQVANTVDAAEEKHVPVVSVDGNKVTVKVGSVEHPMEEKHYIMFIHLVQDGSVIAGKRLKPGDAPEATFTVESADNIKARAYCNLHGLWTS